LALTPFTPARPGIYGINAKPVTFAPNVTPNTFVEPENPDPSASEPSSPSNALFPPSDDPPRPPARKRFPPGKRPSQGYIPRPPNAFMLFRADFVRQKHVPGSIETNHGSLSKIIGNCWQALPPQEKAIWEQRAKKAKADHKALYPDYRFRPVHNKNKPKKAKSTLGPEAERRCEEVTQLLLAGIKGDELRAYTRNTTRDSLPALYAQRRSSSVPLPTNYFPRFDNIAMPTLPFSQSRPASPTSSYRQQRIAFGLDHRRASSVGPEMTSRSWTLPFSMTDIPCHDSQLPEVDTSLFEPSFLDPNASNFLFNGDGSNNINNHQFMNVMNVPPQDSFSPLDTIPPHDGLMFQQPMLQLQTSAEFAPQCMPGLQSQHPSQPSTTYSGSPSPIDPALPPQSQQVAQAGAFPEANMWNGYNAPKFASSGSGMDGMDLTFNQPACNTNFEMQQLGDRLNGLYNPMAFNDGFEFNDAATAVMKTPTNISFF